MAARGGGPPNLAQQALTAQAATQGRFTLGLGLDHRFKVEGVFGYPYDRPVARMREYLSVLVPLIQRGEVKFEGETVTARAALSVPGATACPVLLGALGPRMLELAATNVTDGTVTWMCGPRTLRDHIVPRLRGFAEASGRQPRIVAMVPIGVTSAAAAVRSVVDSEFGVYGHMPVYQSMLSIEQAESPSDTAIVGSEQEVTDAIHSLEAAGVTDLAAIEFGATADDRARTRELLVSLVGAAGVQSSL